MLCPFKPGDVIWVVIDMPCGYVPRLVVYVDGDTYLVYDPFLDMVVDEEYTQPTGHSIGDSGMHRRNTVSESDMARLVTAAEKHNLKLRFRGE